MKEIDWKLFRKLRELALERFSQNALDEIAVLSAANGKGYHQRYLDVFQLIGERDEEMATAFNDPRRSTAESQLAMMVAGGWLTEEECAQFSDETRGLLQRIER